MNRALVALVLVVAAVGCRKKGPNPRIREFKDAICACRDKACGEQLIAAWSHEPEPRGPLSSADAVNVKTIDKCIHQLGLGPLAAGSDATSSGSSDAGIDAPLPMPTNADALIRKALAWPKEKLVVADITVSYVEANGTLDPENGNVRVAFGYEPVPSDDPKRKTGAPVKPNPAKPATCPTLYLDKDIHNIDAGCPELVAYIPKCTVDAIWKRAIEKGAPADALARLRFENTATPSWNFSISDEPRQVRINYDFPDDCERTLEAPP